MGRGQLEGGPRAPVPLSLPREALGALGRRRSDRVALHDLEACRVGVSGDGCALQAWVEGSTAAKIVRGGVPIACVLKSPSESIPGPWPSVECTTSGLRLL